MEIKEEKENFYLDGLTISGNDKSFKLAGYDRAEILIKCNKLEYFEFVNPTRRIVDPNKIVVNMDKIKKILDSKDFVCSICYEIVKNPFLNSRCGHPFCKECLLINKTSKKKECPNCRKEGLRKPMQHELLRNILDDCLVYPGKTLEMLKEQIEKDYLNGLKNNFRPLTTVEEFRTRNMKLNSNNVQAKEENHMIIDDNMSVQNSLINKKRLRNEEDIIMDKLDLIKETKIKSLDFINNVEKGNKVVIEVVDVSNLFPKLLLIVDSTDSLATLIQILNHKRKTDFCNYVFEIPNYYGPQLNPTLKFSELLKSTCLKNVKLTINYSIN